MFLRLILIFFAASFGLWACQPASAPSSPDEASSRRARIDSLLSAYHRLGQFNGTALVSDGQGMVYQTALGIGNVETEAPLEVESRFYLASVAKQMTCMAIMLLEDRDSLGFDDPIQRYFPSLPPWATEVTIRHMMTHTSGIPDYYEMDIPRPGFTNEDVFQALQQVESLDFPPGTDYAYSNSAYVLLSMIVDRASGMTFKQFMESQVFEPLGMEHSVVLDAASPPVTDRVLGYTLELEKDDYQYRTTGGGGIFSNVEDVYKWSQGLDAYTLLPAEKLLQAYEPVRLANDSLSYYGFGWRISKAVPGLVQHSGSLNGFRTFIRRQLDKKNCIILLTNHSNPWLSEIVDQVSNVLNDMPYELPSKKDALSPS